MAAEHESRPLYFANGDFAKTVADIIASPRRYPLISADRRASDSTSTAADTAHPLTSSGIIPSAVPPPIPQRISPPAPIPRKSSSTETQTDGRYVELAEIERFIADFDTQIAELLGDEEDATAGKGVERWARRCEGLRAQNAELESERARMAQVRFPFSSYFTLLSLALFIVFISF
ncbi:hypothetical protein OESDEN_12339 [Oesophagostomum dentatum]|uniref:Uncharacterized protein n=1 Tax=Oesophagostomum dentatum TaxID=61180 RepID=A0A0B1SVE8_OESDE|nr:hypothetical protein OESDEN_12339 [Oesophagostomum dentatum]